MKLFSYRRHQESDPQTVLDAMVPGEPYGSSDLWRTLRIHSRRVHRSLDALWVQGYVDHYWIEPSKRTPHGRRLYVRRGARMVHPPSVDAR